MKLEKKKKLKQIFKENKKPKTKKNQKQRKTNSIRSNHRIFLHLQLK